MIRAAHVVIGAVAVFLLSCSGETVEVRNTVTAYNQMLTEALAKPDPDMMQFFASPRQMKRIRSNLIYITKDRHLLVSEMLSFEFNDTEISGDRKKATVMTRENWRFHFIDQRTRKPVTDKTALMSYDNTYHLVRLDSRWVVDMIEKNVTEKLEGKLGQ
jgi:hypothetical protein